jgi:UDP-N-acetylmuramoyl-tripeptide--D-alanyl-D-alanine ligase
VVENPYMKVKAISTDSRTIKEGEIFFALKGENFDGHTFALDAQRISGMPVCISKMVVEREYILVEDTLRALGSLASFWRRKMDAKIIAVTGSTGKTTTKGMIGSILSRISDTFVSPHNYNNLIGVPLSILKITKKHRYAVIELGTSRRGEIENLGKITMPHIVLITNIGHSHLEFFHTLEEVLREKTSIIKYTKDAVFLNTDDKCLADVHPPNAVTYGIEKPAQFRAKIIKEEIDGSIIVIEGEEFCIPYPGRGNIYNALASISLSLYLEVSPDIIREGIKNAPLEGMRLQTMKKGGITIINDVYNANPESMKNALNLLARFSPRRIAVLGDMLELGENSKELHRAIGKFATHCVDILITTGKSSKYIQEGFVGEKYHFNRPEEVIPHIKGMIHSGDTILIKASRGMHLETIAENLIKGSEKPQRAQRMGIGNHGDTEDTEKSNRDKINRESNEKK